MHEQITHAIHGVAITICIPEEQSYDAAHESVSSNPSRLDRQ
jgi:hypothetical protein